MKIHTPIHKFTKSQLKRNSNNRSCALGFRHSYKTRTLSYGKPFIYNFCITTTY